MQIVNTEAFRAAAEAIANVRPCPVEGRVTADQIKIMLGELLDVWPDSIFEGNAANTKALSSQDDKVI